jgi:K+-transporting ATPase, c chain
LTTSGSGLDPHITLDNAKYQLDRVASKWAANLKRDPAQVRAEIEQILQGNASAPFGGLVGEQMVNVLEVNLQLRQRYGAPSAQLVVGTVWQAVVEKRHKLATERLVKVHLPPLSLGEAR